MVSLHFEYILHMILMCLGVFVCVFLNNRWPRWTWRKRWLGSQGWFWRTRRERHSRWYWIKRRERLTGIEIYYSIELNNLINWFYNFNSIGSTRSSWVSIRFRVFFNSEFRVSSELIFSFYNNGNDDVVVTVTLDHQALRDKKVIGVSKVCAVWMASLAQRESPV